MEIKIKSCEYTDKNDGTRKAFEKLYVVVNGMDIDISPTTRDYQARIMLTNLILSAMKGGDK